MKWKLGNVGGTVVSELPIGDQIESTDSLRYYGGYLIAESIPNSDITYLIKAAPRLLEAAKAVEKGLTNGKGSVAFMIPLLREAIRESEGRTP